MQSNVVRQEFDLKAGEYESNRLAPWYQAHAQQIADYCPSTLDGDILDIGCATGYQLRILAQRYHGLNLVGIDLSGNMINQAGHLAAGESDRFHFIADDWEHLSGQSASLLDQFNFKLIICANTFHYFTDPSGAVEQMLTRLDNDGMLLILEREKSSSLLTLLWGWLHRHFIKDHVQFYTADQICQLLKTAGFSQSNVLKTIRKYFWKGKLFTSIALIKGEK